MLKGPVIQVARGPCLVRPAPGLQVSEQRLLVPAAARTAHRASALPRLDLCCLPDYPRDERLHPLADILPDLDAEYLSEHLAVQELNHPAQLARDLIGDKDKPHLS